MTIYVCLYGYNYEGETVDGIYQTLAAAKKHHWSRGDYFIIQKWSFNKAGVGRMAVAFDPANLRKTKKK